MKVIQTSHQCLSRLMFFTNCLLLYYIMPKLVCFIYKQIYCDKLDDKHVINSYEQVSKENIFGNNSAN